MIIYSQFFPCRRTLRASRRGQTLVEYALIIALIAVVAIGVLLALGNSVNNTIYNTRTQLGTAQTGGAGGANPGGRG